MARFERSASRLSPIRRPSVTVAKGSGSSHPLRVAPIQGNQAIQRMLRDGTLHVQRQQVEDKPPLSDKGPTGLPPLPSSIREWPGSADQAKANAHKAVAEFRVSTAGNKWPNLGLSQLASEMDERIDNPTLISNVPLPLCGPAAIVYLLVRQNPGRFVQIVRQLYETGAAELEGYALSSGGDLRENTPPGGMAQVDWMLLSSMRHTENCFPYEGIKQPTDLDELPGATFGSEMANWMKTILQCKSAEWNSSYLGGELAVAKKAGTAVALGKKAALLIDDDMLDKSANPTIGLPNHWVVLKSPIKITQVKPGEERISFKVWERGSETPLGLPKKKFVTTFFGAAICN